MVPMTFTAALLMGLGAQAQQGKIIMIPPGSVSVPPTVNNQALPYESPVGKLPLPTDMQITDVDPAKISKEFGPHIAEHFYVKLLVVANLGYARTNGEDWALVVHGDQISADVNLEKQYDSKQRLAWAKTKYPLGELRPSPIEEKVWTDVEKQEILEGDRYWRSKIDTKRMYYRFLPGLQAFYSEPPSRRATTVGVGESLRLTAPGDPSNGSWRLVKGPQDALIAMKGDEYTFYLPGRYEFELVTNEDRNGPSSNVVRTQAFEAVLTSPVIEINPTGGNQDLFKVKKNQMIVFNDASVVQDDLIAQGSADGKSVKYVFYQQGVRDLIVTPRDENKPAFRVRVTVVNENGETPVLGSKETEAEKWSNLRLVNKPMVSRNLLESQEYLNALESGPKTARLSWTSLLRLFAFESIGTGVGIGDLIGSNDLLTKDPSPDKRKESMLRYVSVPPLWVIPYGTTQGRYLFFPKLISDRTVPGYTTRVKNDFNRNIRIKFSRMMAPRELLSGDAIKIDKDK